MSRIFISHRTADFEIAEIIRDFLVGIGIDNSDIFCSSLPGNDVEYKIDQEVYAHLRKSEIDIVILSADYFDSSFCTNEQGIIWYKHFNKKGRGSIYIALPEINKSNLLGFVGDNYILRRMDSQQDFAAILDIVSPYSKGLSHKTADYYKTKAVNAYKSLNRKQPVFNRPNKVLSDLKFDEEYIVLFYFLANKDLHASVADIKTWMNKEEIYNIDINHAFKLLKANGYGTVKDGRFYIDTNRYARLLQKPKVMDYLKGFVETKKKSSFEVFEKMWDLNSFSALEKLFIAFIKDTKITDFNSDLIEQIQQWEKRNNLISKLSTDFNRQFLKTFIDNKMIYPISENSMSYRLGRSLSKYLIDDCPLSDEFERLKKTYSINSVILEFHK